MGITISDRTGNEARLLEGAVTAIRDMGWEAMADQFRDEPDKRLRIALFIGHRAQATLGLEGAARLTDLLVAAGNVKV